MPVQQAGTVRQRRRPYKLGGLRADPHLRTAWRRGNTIWERALQPDWEGVRSWRFCRAQIVRVWTPTFAGAYIFCRPRRFQRPPCYCWILWDANILDVARIFYVCADILDRCECHGRKHFMGANISWAQTFHGRKHFMGANISWARIFHGREYFMGANILRCAHTFWLEANILCVNYYFRQAPLFDDFAVSSAQFLQWVLSVFAISFALIFAANICVYFQYLFYACCVRQYFWHKCFEI